MTNEETATLTEIKTTLDIIYKQLFGNGQPGELQQLRSRLDIVEEFKTFIKGAFATLAFVITVIGGSQVWHLFFGKQP